MRIGDYQWRYCSKCGERYIVCSKCKKHVCKIEKKKIDKRELIEIPEFNIFWISFDIIVLAFAIFSISNFSLNPAVWDEASQVGFGMIFFAGFVTVLSILMLRDL